MIIGVMRHRIQVQEKRKGARDLDGGTIRDPWTTKTVRWGRVEPLTGRESFQSQQVDSRTTHRITMRFVRDLNTTNRLMHRKRTFHIISIRDLDERERTMIIMAMENTGTDKV